MYTETHTYPYTETHRYHVDLELLQEALVIGPEEADIGNIEENHGQTLKTQTECPTVCFWKEMSLIRKNSDVFYEGHLPGSKVGEHVEGEAPGARLLFLR